MRQINQTVQQRQENTTRKTKTWRYLVVKLLKTHLYKPTFASLLKSKEFTIR
jgi:hypothetical protein